MSRQPQWIGCAVWIMHTNSAAPHVLLSFDAGCVEVPRATARWQSCRSHRQPRVSDHPHKRDRNVLVCATTQWQRPVPVKIARRCEARQVLMRTCPRIDRVRGVPQDRRAPLASTTLATVDHMRDVLSGRRGTQPRVRGDCSVKQGGIPTRFEARHRRYAGHRRRWRWGRGRGR